MTQLLDVIINHRNDNNRHYPQADYRAFLAICRAKSGLGPLPDIDHDNLGVSLFARVDQGRWVVSCDTCSSAVVVDTEDLFFICTKCGDGWRAVIMPEDKEEIEEVLLMRPGFRAANHHRFWFPGETVDDLADENWEHGLPVPVKHQQRLEAQDAAAGGLE